MGAQHNRRSLRRSNRNHLEIPSHIPKSISDVTDHLTGEALITIRIRQAERDRVGRMRNDRPIPPVPAIGSTMQRIHTIGTSRLRILVRKDMIRRTIDLKTRILDSIRIAAWHAPEMGMLAIDPIVGGIVESAYDVALNAGGVVDEEIGDGCTVRNEVGANSNTVDYIFAVLVRTAR